ncbi:MAG TPA: MmcQ/YjbR family DNA-binding protein [Actinomycetota bacterium]|nr:MmcQ/YjbR family DNA-binding protein [Actinomycetota bacterium]
MSRTPEQIWQAIAAAELAVPGTTAGTGFGPNPGLRVGGKIFAMLARGALVVKLPAERVQELTASGIGRPFDAGKGRPMKEWASIPPEAGRRWKGLVAEARAFVGSA